ncbi:conjugal transfer protein TraG N-terminal domain-containing protein (plasmid) [Cupriavidus metallidurans]|uniref:conjugal transfer protein TraG N-terminal domain-containing protein n=1 Tax=Cupriavidus metallidurans TaxID=119219 RepID=UPI003D75A50D
MLDFNIYVVGDPSSFYAALNAVAMILNQQGFLNSTFLVGGLVALISGILYMIGKQSDGPVPGAMGPVSALFGFFAVVWTTTIPTSVLVNDIYTGNVARVDNVPMIISLPASAFTTASHKLFQLSNTAFQSVNGSYMAVTSDGFVTPLKLLYSLRRGFDNADVFLSASIRTFILDCTPNATSFSMDAMKSSANSLNYILTHARDNGITTYWNTANPQGQSLSCNESAALISQDANVRFLNGTNRGLKELINKNMKEKSPTGNAWGQSDVEDVLQNVLPGGWKTATDTLGMAQSSRDFMINALTYNTIANTFNCMSSNTDQGSFNQCNVQLTQAFEQSRTDSAAAGSFFSKTMMPAMVFMQLMFFSFAPLVIIYGVMKGGGALGMYIKYLLFGIWTSSWLPFSAVIQMYIQNDVAEKLSQIDSGMLTLSNFPAIYYDILATRLSVASDMLAATPLVSLAMLTGTAMSMASLAGRWSGRDHVDEKQTSPDIVRNGPITDVGAATQSSAAITGNPLSGMTRADAALRAHSAGQMLDNNVSSARADVQSTKAEAAASFEKMMSYMKAHSSGFKSSESDITAMSKDYGSRASKVQEAAESAMDSHKFSAEEKSAFQAAITASAGFKSPFGGVEASAQAAATATKGRVSAQDFSKTMTQRVNTDQSWTDSITNRAQNSMDRYSGEDTKTAQGLSASLRQSTARVQSAEQRYQEAVSMKTSMDTSFSVRDQELGPMTMANPAVQNELQKMNDNAMPNVPGYQAKLAQHQNRVQRAGNISGAGYVAIFNALVDTNQFQAASKIMSMLSGINGPTNFSPNANQGVAPAAAAVASNPAAGSLSLKDPHVLQQGGAGAGHAPDASGRATAASGPSTMAIPGGTSPRNPGNGAAAGSGPAAPASGPGDLQARLDRLTNNSLPNFEADKQKITDGTAGVGQGIADQKEAVQSASAVISPEQVRDTFHREVGTVKSGFAGAGMAWGDFEKAHPYMAAGIEAGVTMLPVMRAAGGLKKLYDVSAAAKKGWQGVQAAKAGVSTAAKEMARLEGAFKSPNGALLGGKKVLDARQVANLGFKSSDDFLEAYGKAGANVIKAEKDLLRSAETYSQKFGASVGKDGLPGDATFGFVAQNATRQAVATGKAAGGAGLLELSKYEANIHRQEVMHNQEMEDLRRGVRGR